MRCGISYGRSTKVCYPRVTPAKASCQKAIDLEGHEYQEMKLDESHARPQREDAH